ncbi:MAG: histidinol dehydrogenase, partial [Terriglobia bacterium]
MIPILRSDEPGSLARLERAQRAQSAEAERTARRIIDDVRRHGDTALIRLTRKFDSTDLRQAGFTVSAEEMREARAAADRKVVAALRQAERNIRAAARLQLPRAWKSHRDGVRVGQLIRPLERVACYVPGGRFPLPSTVLMSVIPAQVAGVKEIIITSPRPAPSVLVASSLLGVQTVFRLGGAQAIAAFAYGTTSVPRADKIVGPGNRYVAAAKKLVAGDCGIDFAAGPSELVVLGSKGNPKWIAADLVAQAEHDPDASAVFITCSLQLALRVQKAIAEALARLKLPLAEKSLARRGAIIFARSMEQAIALVNRLAPEHLTLLEDAASFVGRIESAGAIFAGSYSPVAAGDYASGGNHILPTAGAARQRGGLTSADFVKTISFQQLNRSGLSRLRKSIVTLAETEGLRAHAWSVDAR